MVDLWRIRHRAGTSVSSHSRVNIYESRRQAESALYRLLLDLNSDGGARTGASERHPKHQWFRWWRDAHQEDEDDGRVHCLAVLAVEHLVDGEWVPYEFELLPPKLVLNPTGQPPTDQEGDQ